MSVQAFLFLEEMFSIVLTPFVLYFSLPKCAGAITQFVRDFTTSVEGVGDICSMAAFDLRAHGNARYGSPFDAGKVWTRFLIPFPTSENHFPLLPKHSIKLLQSPFVPTGGVLNPFSADSATRVVHELCSVTLSHVFASVYAQASLA